MCSLKTPTAIIRFLAFLTIFSLQQSFIAKTCLASQFSEIIVFGDSLSDTGNIVTRFGSLAPVYSGDRLSNGPLWVERLAEKLGVSAPTASARGGLNYAWAGATTGSVSSASDDMDFQVRQYLSSHAPSGEQLFVLWGGANDFFQQQHDVSAPVQYLGDHLAALADAGARSILVNNLPRRFGSTSVPQAEEFNRLLAAELDELRSSHEDLSIFEFDYFSFFDSVVADPALFGFSNMIDPACSDCGFGANPNASMVVSNPEEYYFWDDVHPTALTHQYIGDAAHTLFLSVPIAGDFDGNGVLGVADVNLLSTNANTQTDDARFDLNSDELVDAEDLRIWVKDLKGTWFGDANLDGEFNTTDLIDVFQASKYEVDAQAGWSEGDWTGDQRFDTADLIAAFQDNGFEQGPRTVVNAVPEPSGMLLLTLGLFSVARIRIRLRLKDRIGDNIHD